MRRLKWTPKQFGVWGAISILVLLSLIPIRLAIASYLTPYPQAILVLGGSPDREAAAAELAQENPHLEVWISTGSPPSIAHQIFRATGVASDRLHLDYRAVDTVTNFTTLVSDFKQRHIQHLILITSDYHMPRAIVIATFVLGSQGIAFTPIAVQSRYPQAESLGRIFRDGGRAVIWIITRRTGASLRSRLNLSPPSQTPISLRGKSGVRI
jgi:uncharacterized SAM-binding protein YcdF (DUF218 family)